MNGPAVNFLLSLVCVIGSQAGVSFGSTLVASDDASDPAYAGGWYASGDGSGQSASNGGFGFEPWEVAEDEGEVGLQFLDTSSDRVSPTQSFAIDTGATSFGLFRPLANPVTYGIFSVAIRFDSPLAGGGTGFNIDGGNKFLLSVEFSSATGPDALEVLNGSQHSLQFSPDPQLSLVGDLLDFNTTFNTSTGAYVLSVTDETNDRAASMTGTLQFTGLPVNEFFFGTGQFGSQTQVMDFDSMSVSVPEPAGLILVGWALICGLQRRSWR